jgi:intracellular sulfur oxidation DsrE/DsrF family protein
MTRKLSNQNGRRRFLTNIGLVTTAATLTATAAQAASQVPSNSRFSPAKHPQDSWLEVSGVAHRAFIDSATAAGGMTALHYANNVLFGHTTGYDGEESDYALVVCFRHLSTPFGYSDAIWAKYGELFSRFMGLTDRETGGPFKVNPMNIAGPTGLGNNGNTIDSLIARGVSYAICNKATQSMSARLAQATKSSAEEIYQEIIAAPIPASRFVPAGVVAVTRAQEYGYSLLYAG